MIVQECGCGSSDGHYVTHPLWVCPIHRWMVEDYFDEDGNYLPEFEHPKETVGRAWGLLDGLDPPWPAPHPREQRYPSFQLDTPHEQDAFNRRTETERASAIRRQLRLDRQIKAFFPRSQG